MRASAPAGLLSRLSGAVLQAGPVAAQRSHPRGSVALFQRVRQARRWQRPALRHAPLGASPGPAEQASPAHGSLSAPKQDQELGQGQRLAAAIVVAQVGMAEVNARRVALRGDLAALNAPAVVADIYFAHGIARGLEEPHTALARALHVVNQAAGPPVHPGWARCSSGRARDRDSPRWAAPGAAVGDPMGGVGLAEELWMGVLVLLGLGVRAGAGAGSGALGQRGARAGAGRERSCRARRGCGAGRSARAWPWTWSYWWGWPWRCCWSWGWRWPSASPWRWASRLEDAVARGAGRRANGHRRRVGRDWTDAGKNTVPLRLQTKIKPSASAKSTVKRIPGAMVEAPGARAGARHPRAIEDPHAARAEDHVGGAEGRATRRSCPRNRSARARCRWRVQAVDAAVIAAAEEPEEPLREVGHGEAARLRKDHSRAPSAARMAFHLAPGGRMTKRRVSSRDTALT